MNEHANGLSRRRFFFGAAAFGTMLAVAPRTAFAETSAEKQAQADEARNQLVSLQADLEKASNDYYGALADQEAAEQAMVVEQGKIDEANERISAIQSRLSVRVTDMYRTGPISYLDFLLGSKSFEDFTTNWSLLTSMNEQDGVMVNEAKTLREERQAAYDEYARQKDVAADRAAAAEEAKNSANARVAEATEIVNSLDEEARQLLEQEQAAAAIVAAQAAAQAAAQEAAQAASTGAATGEATGATQGDAPSPSQGLDFDGGASDVGESWQPSDTGSQDSGGDSGYDPAPPSVGYYDSVVGYAMSRIGCPYVWGAEGPDSFDCSGLVRWAYLQVGISLPHQTESLYARATNIVSVSEARPGDVLYRYGHVGIAVGYGGVPYVHAPTFGAYVRDTDALSWSGFTCALQF